MAAEIFGWLGDLSGYARVAGERIGLRQPGKGVDYTDPRYHNLVRRTIEQLHPRRMKLRVSEVVPETPTAKTLRCERLDGPIPPFRAGQYVNVFVTIDGVATSRPYSISSAPGMPFLDLTVRDKAGGFVASRLLAEARAGMGLETTGPVGSFYHEGLIDGSDLVFLAGGSGVTPFMSILRDQDRAGFPLRIHLLHGSRKRDDVIFGAELKEMAKRHANFRYTLVLSEAPKNYKGPKGLLDAKAIRKHVGAVEGRRFYVCGPNAMYDLCLSALTELGVPEFKIRRELYGPPGDVTAEPGWPQGLSPDAVFQIVVVEKKAFSARAGEPLMNSLEREGLALPAECRSGACSACRTKLLAGRVFMPSSAGLRESDRAGGYIHPCVSYPIEDLRIRI